MDKRFYRFLSVFFLFLFALFSLEASSQILRTLDFNITVMLQESISRQFDVALSYFSLLGSFEITVFFILGMFTYLLVKKKKLFLGLGFFFVAIGMELLGKIFISHPSPPPEFFRYDLGFFLPSFGVKTGFSYPSGHMMRTAFILAIGFFMVMKSSLTKHQKYLSEISLIVFGVLMFISRIYLGEHWFSDVVGGLFLGLAAGMLSLSFL